MSTFLQLAQDTRRECGISGTPGVASPTSVVGQTGELDRVVNWVKNSYIELQDEEPNWRWLRSEFSIQTTASVDSYAFGASGVTDAITGTAITRFARWWTDEFQLFLTSAGIATRHPIQYLRWDAWRRVWLIGSQNPAYPSMGSIDPRDNLRLGAKPDGIYTFTGEYQKSAQVLALDADVPEMPAQYHQIIVARAMKKYAAFHSASEVYAQANDIENALYPGLRLNQLPPPRYGNPIC